MSDGGNSGSVATELSDMAALDEISKVESVLQTVNKTSTSGSRRSLPESTSRFHIPGWMRDWRTCLTVGVSVFVIALALWRLLLNEADKQSQFEDEVGGVMQWYETALIGQISASLSSLHALSALLKVDDRNVTVDNFPSIADMLIEQLHGITNLQLAPYGTVSQIHPLEGNEGAIGHALLLDPARVTGALATIEQQSVGLVGPLTLLQGGTAIIARLAVFSFFASEFLPDETWTNSDGEMFSRSCSDLSALDENCKLEGRMENGTATYFWGFATMVTLVSDLLATLDFEGLEEGSHLDSRFHWRILDRTAHASQESVHGIFAHSSSAGYGVSMDDPLCKNIDISDLGVDWQLCVSPYDGWPTVSSEFWIQLSLLVVATGLMATAAGFMVIGSVRGAHKRLQRLEEYRSQRKLAVVENCVADVDRLRFPMCVMDFQAFTELGVLIAHEKARDEGKLRFLDTDAEIKATAPHVAFVSHQWTGFGKPDHTGTQYKCMVQACKVLLLQGFDVRWVWVDIFSIPQDNVDQQQGSIDSLAVYAAHCQWFVSAVPVCEHAELNIRLDVHSYFSRAWCRLEQLAYLSATSHMETLLAYRCTGEVLEPLFDEHDEHQSALTHHWVSALEVLKGEFTCCSRGHPDFSMCDRERIVCVLLGILWRCKKSRGSERMDKMLSLIDAKPDRYFPSSYMYTSEGKSESRELFGDLFGVLQRLYEESMAIPGFGMAQRRGVESSAGADEPFSVSHSNDFAFRPPTASTSLEFTLGGSDDP